MDIPNHSSLITLFAGIAFFKFGMTIAAEALQKLAANRVRELLLRLSDNNFLGVLVGIALTILLQSSGAVTSMLVSLGSARVITLSQVMGVITGAAVGTTLTVQLISFDIAQYGLSIFAIAFTFYFITQKRTVKNVMAAAMGFGMIFLGIEMISHGSTALAHMPVITEAFKQFSENPWISLAVSAILSTIAHSSAVAIGLAMGLCSSGVISLYDAMFWVYGANIGTTSTALIASVGTNYIGRQVAWAHFFYKVSTCAIFALLTIPLLEALPWLQPEASRQIANAHTILNVAAAVMFFPFIRLGATWIEKLIPPTAGEKEFSPQYLAESTSQTLAIAYANREILRMGDIVLTMVKDALDMFRTENPDLIVSIRKRDDQVDLLTREINLFLVRHSRESTEGVNPQIFELISYCSDLEAAADVIDNSTVHLAAKMHALKVNFSEVGWREIEEFHREILQIVSQSLTSFQMKDSGLAQEVISLKRKLRERERQLKASHIERLNKGLTATINTSSIHMDLLGDFRRIVGLMTNHCYNYSSEAEPVARRSES